VGSGFGGYAALLGAARNSDTYRCAISINGIADLQMQIDHGIVTGNKALRRLQIGDDPAKLARDSPLKLADKINIPVLLIASAKDWQVQPDHSKAMASALTRGRKKVEYVVIKGANHDLERQSDRVKLLEQVEAFLSAHLGAGKAS